MEHLMLKLEKTLMLGKIEGKRRGDSRGWDGWMASPTEWTWVWASSWRWWRTGKPGMLQCMASQSWTQLSNWTTKRMLNKFLSEEQRNLEVWRHTENNYCSQMTFRLLNVPKKQFIVAVFITFHLCFFIFILFYNSFFSPGNCACEMSQ